MVVCLMSANLDECNDAEELKSTGSFKCTTHPDSRSKTDSAERSHPASKTMFASFGQLAKQDRSILLIDEGRRIARSDKQPENADSPRFDIREPDSNFTSESCLQFQKHRHEIVSIHEGIQTN
jgi:hypothetical protein